VEVIVELSARFKEGEVVPPGVNCNHSRITPDLHQALKVSNMKRLKLNSRYVFNNKGGIPGENTVEDEMQE